MILLLSFVSLPGAAMESKSEKEVLAVMSAWRQAMVDRDRAMLEKVYAPGLIYTHSNGRQENKAEAIEAVVNGKDRIESLDLTDMSVSLYGTTAIVRAKVLLRMSSGGNTNTLNLYVLHVWIKHRSGWQMVARHALRLNPQ
jgi:ketosteroid isomerase-like protein